MANLINIINTAANHMAKIAMPGYPNYPEAKEYTSGDPIDSGETQIHADGGLDTTQSLNDIAEEAAVKEDTPAYGPKESKPSLGYRAKGELNQLKYHTLDNPAFVHGAVGAAGAGAAAYLLAKLLKKKRAWAYALGGAAVGGTAGALGGAKAAEMIKTWLASRKNKGNGAAADSMPSDAIMDLKAETMKGFNQ